MRNSQKEELKERLGKIFARMDEISRTEPDPYIVVSDGVVERVMRKSHLITGDETK